MEKLCWFCKRNIEKLKAELPKDFWPQNCDFFVDIEVEGRIKNATAPYSASYSASYYENLNYEFVTVQKSVCLICIQIMDIENEKAIYRVKCYEGTSYLESDRVGIYNSEKFYKLADDFILENHFNNMQRLIDEVEDDYGSVYVEVIINKILERRNNRNPRYIIFTDDFLETEILLSRFAKELEKSYIYPDRFGYNLEGKKLIKHLRIILQKLKEKNEESFEYTEETDILKVTRISAFFKMLKKQKHDFGVKLNKIRESISYSREEMEALFSDILEETD